MSQAVAHLYSNESYDESEVWCSPGATAPFVVDEDGRHVPCVRDPHESTCRSCLSAAASFGQAAIERLRILRGGSSSVAAGTECRAPGMQPCECCEARNRMEGAT